MPVVSLRQRGRQLAIAVAASVLAAGAPGVLAGTAQAHAKHRGRPDGATHRHRSHRRHRHAVRSSAAAAPLAFDMRLSPTFEVGQAGWNVVVQEDGKFGGSTGIGVIHPSTPLVSVSATSKGGSHESTTTVVTLPEVAAVQVEGGTRVPTEALPGLPFGLRAARVVSPFEEPEALPGSHAGHVRLIEPMVALAANGEPIPQSTSRETRETPFQGTVHKWSAPGREPQGSCELHAGGAGVSAESGVVLGDVRPYPGHIFGDAFLPCNATVYSLGGQRLRAYVLLDAANPGSLPAGIPGLSPVPGVPGVYSGESGFYGGPGELTARRSGGAWVAVEGAEAPERIQLLEDLSATVEL